jgi:class 3 adenylate cyclase
LDNHLKNAGYLVEKASDGSVALRMIEKNPDDYDLIILDIMMPHISGYEVCVEIRKKHPPAVLPIILLTAKNRVSDLMKGFEVGANDYLVKPFSKGELLSRIQSLLGIHEYAKATERFVPHAFLKRIGKDEILNVHRGDHALCDVTVMFADIRNYTLMSEKMSPEENFRFVNEYVGYMGPLIQREKGFVNQYLGDGIMAIFPEESAYSLKAAIAMQKRVNGVGAPPVKALNKQISIGVGLHTGPLILGIIGDENRSDPATLADTVNIASRIEGLTKHFGANIILSEESKALLDNEDDYHLRYLGKVQVKGKKNALSIFECYDGDYEHVAELKNAHMDSFNEALSCYYNRDFTDACVILKGIINKNPQDKVAFHFYRKAASYMIEEPPESWTGVESVLIK